MSMTFRRVSGGRLLLVPDVVATLLRHAQHDRSAVEAGGVLIGRWILGSDDVVVDSVTCPAPQDTATRVRFSRSRAPHQAAVDRAWQQSGGTQTWLGEWHTHPEPDPTPSFTDIRGWFERMSVDRADGDALFFVIVGTTHLRVWEGLRAEGCLVKLVLNLC